MKKLIYLLLVSTLLTSCLSHTALTNNSPSMHPMDDFIDRPVGDHDDH